MERCSNHLRAANIGFNIQFICTVTRLVSATVTGVTRCSHQFIYKVGAAVLYMNVGNLLATTSTCILSNADFLWDNTLSHCRVTFTQPGREDSTTSVDQWTCGHHFSPRISLEAIPAIEFVFTFGLTCCIGAIFSVCVCQIFVRGTFK